MTRRAKKSENLKIVLASSDVQLLRVLHREVTTAGFQVVGTTRDQGTLPAVMTRTGPALAVVDEAFAGVIATVTAEEEELSESFAGVAVLVVSDFGLGASQALPGPVMGILHKPPYLPGEIRNTSLLAVKKYQEAERLRAELQDKERLLEERKAVEKAKGLLMQDLRLSETEAYHRLRKLAMDRREPLFQMANAVLLAYQLREEGLLSLF